MRLVHRVRALSATDEKGNNLCENQPACKEEQLEVQLPLSHLLYWTDVNDK